MEHWFGLPLPEGVKALRHWGARAIIRLNVPHKPVRRKGRRVGTDLVQETIIEMVSDRSQYRGPDIESPAAKTFFRWLDKDALPKLRKEADRVGLAGHDDQEIAIHDGAYHLLANPRKSYGYIYIVAWEDGDGTTT